MLIAGTTGVLGNRFTTHLLDQPDVVPPSPAPSWAPPTTCGAHLDRIVDAVPFTPYDLPGYAVALYDSYLTDPELVRLASWNRLERVPTGELLAAHPGLADPKHEAIAQAQAEGRIVAGIRPDEVYALIIALAGTWSPISATYTASPDEGTADHERRRSVPRGAARRALVPPIG